MIYSFGFTLREERERLGLNQTEFAEACGVKQLAQSNYENNKRKPDAAYLLAAANLGVDMNYLFTGVRTTSAYEAINKADETEMSSKKQKLLDAYDRMSDENKRAILQIGESLSQPKSG